MKVMAVGDTHCNTQFAIRATRYAKANEINTIVALGDFGYQFAKDFMSVWKIWLENDADRVLYWLDGNHDDHDYIAKFMEGEDPLGPVAHWHPRFLYMPRGSTTTIGDTKCQFLGGAYSIDRPSRKLGTSWWEGECVSDDDVTRTIRNGSGVQVMFTHDCPDTTWFQDALKGGAYKIDPGSRDNRERVTKAVKAVSPDTVFHGHYHYSYRSELATRKGVTKVVGLAADHDELFGRIHTAEVTDGHNVYVMDL
jgi:hypothetical protein